MSSLLGAGVHSRPSPFFLRNRFTKIYIGSSGKKGAKSGSRLRLRELLKELLREFPEPSVLAYPKLRIKAALLRSGRKRKIGGELIPVLVTGCQIRLLPRGSDLLTLHKRFFKPYFRFYLPVILGTIKFILGPKGVSFSLKVYFSTSPRRPIGAFKNAFTVMEKLHICKVTVIFAWLHGDGDCPLSVKAYHPHHDNSPTESQKRHDSE